MKKILYKPLFILAFLSLSSCEDFFETTIEIDPPVHTERLVVQGFGSTAENKLNVLVSKTVGLLEEVNNEDLLINDATVRLIHDGVSYELEYTETGQNQGEPYNYILKEGNIEFMAEETYRLEVESEGFDTAIGICTVPRIILPHSFEFQAEGPSAFDDEFSKVSMVLTDPIGLGDNYEFVLNLGNEFNGQFFYDRVYTESFDLVVEESLYSLFLRDESFDGEDKILDLLMARYYVENEEDVADRLYINWRTVTDDHLKYNSSFDDHLENADNPFSTPVQVYSNIENGLGIFSIYNEQRLKIN